MTTHLADLNGPLSKLADAHCVVSKDYSADFLAVAWYRLAPLPSGQWAVQYGAWCQGVGTADFPWASCRDAAEGASLFIAAVRELCHRQVECGLAKVQQKARERLWAKVIKDHPADPPALDAGTLPKAPGLAEQANAHRPLLLAIAYGVLGDPDAAEDAVQNALLGIHRYGHTFTPDGPLLPWLRAVVRNAAKTQVRRMKVERAGSGLEEAVDHREGHEDGVDRNDLAAAVKAATWALEPVSRKAFRLCYLDGLTHAEIAAKLRRRVGSINGLVYRARLALRRRLAEAV